MAVALIIERTLSELQECLPRKKVLRHILSVMDEGTEGTEGTGVQLSVFEEGQ